MFVAVGEGVSVGVKVMVGVGVRVLVGLARSVSKSQVGLSSLEVRVAAKDVPVTRKSYGSGFDTVINTQGRIVIKAKITNKKLMRKTGRILDSTVVKP